MAPIEPEPADVRVGIRIRDRRRALKLTQVALASSLGVTFQQLQKYESGSNRVAASRLQAMARLLDVEIAFFFDEAPALTRSSLDVMTELLTTKMDDDARTLNEMFRRIRSRRLRRSILALIEAISAGVSDRGSDAND